MAFRSPFFYHSSLRARRCFALPRYGAQSLVRPGAHLPSQIIARQASSEIGDNSTGHIEAGSNEGILFFDNIFPLKLQWILRFSFNAEEVVQRIQRPSAASIDPVDLIEKALPEDKSVRISGVTPRLKDGGAFVKFTHDAEMKTTDIEDFVRKHLLEQKIRPWWNPFSRVHSHLVLGRPWVEDLYRPPSSRLRVEFTSDERNDIVALSQEQLYSLFRPYGKIREITSQPSDSKVLPKYTFVDFSSTKTAIMARNCLHGYIARSDSGKLLATIKIAYERKQKTNWFMDWLSNHPRIALPLLAALAAAFTVTVLDPIRTFYVKMHVTRAFHLSDNRIIKWLVSRATNLFPLHRRSREDQAMSALFDDRRENIEQIKKWLMETADTFIVIQGPRGSGKKELVIGEALKHRKNKLVIDCKPVQEARGDSSTISSLADQVGYKPVFSWMNSISGLVDLAAQGATGIKTGFTETLDTQIAKILTNTATALKDIALEGRKKNDRDGDMADDVYLEAHPEQRPVVVIDNFLHRSHESTIFYDKLAEWTANVTTANIAHVIFLTTDVSFSKSLSKALPDRVFRQISLGDCAPDVAKRFVISHLDPIPEEDSPNGDPEKPLTHVQRRRDLAELDGCISYLGGRLTDLEFLARRIRAGESPSVAVKEIIDQSASEILKMYIIAGDTDYTGQQKHWTSEQAWVLIKRLAEDNEIRYNEVLLTTEYATEGDVVLQALEQAELISIVSQSGRPYAIKPGKPVFQPAFKLLTEDKVLNSRLDMSILGNTVKSENAAIAKCEEELNLLAQLPKQPAELAARVHYLLSKISASQMNVEQTEAKIAGLKKILSTEY